MARGIVFTLLVLGMLVAHTDFWFWWSPEPLLFGFVPVGLWYQGLFAVGCAVLMWLMVKFVWPSHLETLESEPDGRRNEGGH